MVSEDKFEFVDNADLKKGFVCAYNKFITDNPRVAEWKNATQAKSPLRRLRAKQLIELAEQDPLTSFVEELAQLVLVKVTVLGARRYEFTFMDGSKIKVAV